jgi:SAM-dependent methyltransferase
MPIKTIEFKNYTYPAFQSEGFAARFAFPFADEILEGVGFDIGCNRLEWSLPNDTNRIVIPIDPIMDPQYDAFNLPLTHTHVDFIFSSHCLEHLTEWVSAIDYWRSRLKSGGVLFLYLPNMDRQKYWQPWHNRKHMHYMTPEILRTFFHFEYEHFEDIPNQSKWSKVFISESDLNDSFYVVAEKM